MASSPPSSTPSPPPSAGRSSVKCSEFENLYPLVERDTRLHLHSHSRRYNALAVLFFSPFVISTILFLFTIGIVSYQTALALAVSVVLSLIPVVFGVSLVTYIVVHNIFASGEKIIHTICSDTLKTVFSCWFLPMLVTMSAGFCQIALILLPFVAIPNLLLLWLLGFDAVPNSFFIYYMFMCMWIIAIGYLPQWGLSAAISVTEGRWGFDCLRRSELLLRSARRESEAKAIFWVLWSDLLRMIVFPTCLFIQVFGKWFIFPGTVIWVGVSLFTLCWYGWYYTIANVCLYLYCAVDGEVELGAPIPAEKVKNFDRYELIYLRSSSYDVEEIKTVKETPSGPKYGSFSTV